MNVKHVIVVSAIAVMFLSVIAFLTPGSEFSYEKSLALSQVNNCSSSGPLENVWCQNIATQIQSTDDSTAPASAKNNGVTDDTSNSRGSGTGGVTNDRREEIPSAPITSMGGSNFGGAGTG